MATTEAARSWQTDLGRAGVFRQGVRRLWQSRRWYGADWWFVLISAVALVIFLFVALFPQAVAPYDPATEVGPAFLAPGQAPEGVVIAAKTGSKVTSIADLTGASDTIGIIAGGQASEALRTQEDTLNAALDAKNQPEIHPDLSRYDTVDQMIADLEAGSVTVILGNRTELATALQKYPDLSIVGPLSQAGKNGFLLGTDELGQDEATRLIWGTRIAFIVGLSSAMVAALIGIPLGLFSGFSGGALDRGLTLVMDSLYSFPGLILAIAISAVLGPGIGNVIVAIAVLYIPTYYRVVRGQTLAIKQELYVEAAQSLGANRLTVLWRYVFPNVISSVVVLFSVNVADAILTEAGLSFLGLGLPPDIPDWGIALAKGQQHIRDAWWLITYPGLLIMFVTLSFSMLGESLSEILNPRLNRI